MMELKMTGEAELIKRLKDKEKEYAVKAKQAINIVLSEMVTYIKTNGLWKDRTGNLRNSIDTKKAIKRGDSVIGYIYAGMEYAVYVEYKPNNWVISGALVKFKPDILARLKELMK